MYGGLKRVALQENNLNVANAVLTDSDITLPVDMDHRYLLEASIPFRLLGAVSGYKFSLDAVGAPAGTVLSGTLKVYDGVGNVLQNVKVDQNAPLTIQGNLGAGLHLLEFEGILMMGTGAPAVFKLQLAQNTLDAANAIRLLKNAYLEMEDAG